MTKEDRQIENEGIAIFGEFDLQAVREAEPGRMAAFAERSKNIGREMDLFIESLPNWVEGDFYFLLYTMTEKERSEWLAQHNPNIKSIPENLPKPENQPYFQKSLAPKGAFVKVGNIRA